MSRLFRDVDGGCVSPRGSVVCIGAFDGLHLGHQALVGRVAGRAHEFGLEAAVLSFEPLPREFFGGERAPARLTLPRERIEGLLALGVDLIGLLRFNAALAAMPAEDFVRQVIGRRLNAREVWVGPDFRFGRGRAGDVELLRRLGAELGFEARVMDQVDIGGSRVSASRIRELLGEGELDVVAELLGHTYRMSGRVTRGRQLGRRLGYPTANLRLGGKVPALRGIFASRVHGVGPVPLPAVSSLGTRPTVDGAEPLLETHVFDFEGDLYGRRIGVEFIAKLRDEQRFDNLDALVAQMDRDAAAARELLNTSNPRAAQ